MADLWNWIFLIAGVAVIATIVMIDIRKIKSEENIDVIFLSSEPFPFKESDALEIQQLTHHVKIIFVDGEMFSWYGSRLLKAFDYFKKIHQELGFTFFQD